MSAAGTMAEINPLRYRGYYFDSETELYYLQSRYYDPTTCRFINADAYASTGQGILGHNMFAYCNNNPINLSDLWGNQPTEAVDTDGDSEPDYYKYEYAYTYIVLLPDPHNPSSFVPFEITAHGTVYFFPKTDRDFFDDPDNIPTDFNPLTDLLVADIPDVENVTFYAPNAHYVDVRMRDGILKTFVQYDKDFSRGFNRTHASLKNEWFWHMFLGGRIGVISRLTDVDFDRNAEKMTGFDYIGKAIEETIATIIGWF